MLRAFHFMLATGRSRLPNVMHIRRMETQAPAEAAQAASTAWAGIPVATRARPIAQTSAKSGSWMTTIPYAKSIEKPRAKDRLKLQKLTAASKMRCGAAGASLLRHERSRWLFLRPRAEPTKEWQEAMQAKAEFRKYLEPPKYSPTQMEAICLACSNPQNSKFLTSNNELAEFFPERPPKVARNDNGDLVWQEHAWFHVKDWTRHERRADHTNAMLNSFPDLAPPAPVEVAEHMAANTLVSSELTPVPTQTPTAMQTSSQESNASALSPTVAQLRAQDALPGGPLSSQLAASTDANTSSPSNRQPQDPEPLIASAHDLAVVRTVYVYASFCFVRLHLIFSLPSSLFT